jgi:predicted phage terminase large subunit-like protein
MKDLDRRLRTLEAMPYRGIEDLPDDMLAEHKAEGNEAATAELLRRSEARDRLIPFCQFTFPGYQPAAHLVALAEKLEAVKRGEIKRLMVFLPPRHGKSELCSIRFPAWYLGDYPQAQIIGCSYAEGLAYTFSYAIRETVTSPQYQRLWQYQLDQAGAVRWQLAGKADLRASYIAAGVGGSIIGEGADLLIIDDPVKNVEEAESKNQRDRVWDWYRTVARTRLQPDAAVIVIMSRWHKDDLAGRLLELAKSDPKADQWEVLHLLAIEDEQALWPERYPLDTLEVIKASIGGRAFASLYQGEPATAEGNIFKREWWRYYKELPSFSRKIHSWDTAFKAKSSNDYSVCTVWGETQNGYYLVDIWRGRAEFPELKRVAVSLYERDKPAAVLIEDAASGQSLIQEFQRDTKIPLLPVKADRDKVVRAYSVTPLIEAGRVYLPEWADWLYDYVEELSAFPNGQFDDQVDSTTQALGWLNACPMPDYEVVIFDALEAFAPQLRGLDLRL